MQNIDINSLPRPIFGSISVPYVEPEGIYHVSFPRGTYWLSIKEFLEELRKNKEMTIVITIPKDMEFFTGLVALSGNGKARVIMNIANSYYGSEYYLNAPRK